MDRSAQPAPETAPSAEQEAAPVRDALKEPKRTKRQPVITLEDFFARRAAKASTFLKDLREADRWEFAPEDVQAALETHAVRDKDFSRTTQLIAAALKERDTRFARPVIGFGEAAIRHRLADNPRLGGDESEAGLTATEKIERVARALGPRLREPKRRGEAANLLLATMLCASRDAGLAARDAVARLVSALEIEPSRASERAALGWLGEKPKELRPALEVAAPWIRSTRQLEERASELEARADVERIRRSEAEGEIARLSALVIDLEKVVADTRAEIERLEEGLRATDVHADHDARRMKARLAGLLDGQLRDLIATIDEALSLDPPRTEVAREKVAVVFRELERQVSWLRS